MIRIIGVLTGASLAIGGQVTRFSNRGIWVQGRNGKLVLVARTGGQLEVAPGDRRTVARLAFLGGTGNENGRNSGFNDRGQIAFQASFTDDSSGVFVFDINQ